MALTGNRLICKIHAGTPFTHLSLCRPFLVLCSSIPSRGRSHIIVSATKKVSIRRIIGRNKQVKEDEERSGRASIGPENDFTERPISAIDDGFTMTEHPGSKADFWKGSQWAAFGFFIQYLWDFGIAFALIVCSVAVTPYNDGAADFKETPAYKESVQTQELLEGPDVSTQMSLNPIQQRKQLLWIT